MGQPVIHNEESRFTIKARSTRGFTLIEVMVALVVLALGLLGSVIGIMSVLDHGLMNEVRNDGIKIAQEQAEAARNMPYANIAGLQEITITRQVRNAQVTYTVTPAVNQVQGAGGYKMTLVTFTVQWQCKIGDAVRPFTYILQTIVRGGN